MSRPEQLEKFGCLFVPNAELRRKLIPVQYDDALVNDPRIINFIMEGLDGIHGHGLARFIFSCECNYLSLSSKHYYNVNAFMALFTALCDQISREN